MDQSTDYRDVDEISLFAGCIDEDDSKTTNVNPTAKTIKAAMSKNPMIREAKEEFSLF